MANATPMAAGHPDMDYAEHERTYHGFLRVARIAVISIVTLLILMAFFLL